MNNNIGIDYLQEAIILGIDVVIFGLCLKGYHSTKNTIKALKVRQKNPFISVGTRISSFSFEQDAPQLNIDKDLPEYVGAQKDKKVPYAIVRGTVAPIGKPLQSMMSPSVTGVLQVIKVK